ncbi:chromosome partitioning protein ParB [Mesorhizobium sp. M7A.F.Ca.US.002.01.1.1]|uniref:plasmid partitioning protein RepB C-terminal domain-containing protein n=1 Tax=Mesorhizobium sp. M7A.F.Ca.US.002.01.1.1 TaxID=2496700 RepID=UPI000FD2EED8|nr:plasmid partitioning protein RepB C-terminal domain-containing protein [Mesorhizobium sp. M7A.F.Ca.US.002.01.1.1]RVA14641.1 chromosome partitioning protein ParB [Mesorhizobium sp. M7A.F.Ca.US.002.01.1.1]
MTAMPAQRVEMIPIDQISVVNPRIRNKRIFRDIVDNISEIGLKRPITVARRPEAEGPFYDLVCGQGRLEAYKALGQQEVPALVVTADPEDCLVASLVENCARRKHQAVDLLNDIGRMKQQGHPIADIARKTGLTAEYVHAVVRLLENGEQRLLRAVESGQIPFSVALDIAEADDQDVQSALQNAYEKNLLRGRKLLAAKRLVEQRRVQGKRLKSNPHLKPRKLSTEALVRAYQQETDRKRLLIRRAQAASNRLIFIAEAVRRLLQDDDFRDLLTKEGLTTLPKNLAQRLDRLEASNP